MAAWACLTGAYAQTPPYGCTAATDAATIQPGAVVQLTMHCPPVPTGWRAAPFEARLPGAPVVFRADDVSCPSAPELTVGASRATSGPPGTEYDFGWEVCNCARTVCAYTNKVRVTVAGTAPTGCQATLFGTSGNAQFPDSSGGNVPVAVQNCSPSTGLTYSWRRDGVPGASTAPSWIDTPAQNSKLGQNTGSTPVSTGYQVEVCNGGACATFPPAPLLAIVPPATAPAGCQVTLLGTSGDVQLPSSGGSVPVAVQSCSPATGLTYNWRRDGVPGASTLASWTDTPALNPKLGPNATPSPVITGYQVQVCNGTACAVFPSSPRNAIVPPAGAPVCAPFASNASPALGQTIQVTANCTNSPTSYAWSGCTSSSDTCTDSSTTAGAKTYTVTAANAAGSAQASTVVNWGGGGVPVCTLVPVPAQPQVGQAVTLTAGCSNNPTSYTWTGCASTTSQCMDTLATQGTKQYSVVARNAAGTGPSASATVTWGPPDPLPPTPPGTGTVAGAATGAADSGVSALIRDDLTLWTWGSNAQRTLGDGSAISRSVPAPVAGLQNIVGSASALHTLALTGDGRVYAWGPNGFGELGLGTRTAQARPTLVPGLTDIVAVAAGDHFSLALQRDGTVWAFGRNHVGQLGDGTAVDRLAPVRVAGLSDVTSIAASFSHAAAVRTDGTVWVWGDDLYVPQQQSSRPVQVPIAGAKLVQAGGLNTFVLKTDGTVWGWGRPDGGRLGDGGAGNGRVPVQVSGLVNIVSLAVGEAVSIAVNASGGLFGWGENGKGQLGLRNTNVVGVPIALSVPTTGTISRAASGDSSFVVDSRGRLFGAGRNELGALGLGDTLDTRAPKLVGGIGGVTAVAAGPTESLALRSDGTVWSWGSRNPADVAGANAQPRQVAGLAGRFVSIAAGSTNVIALRDDGAVFGWGSAVPGAPSAVTLAPNPIPLPGAVVSAATGAAGVIGLTAARRAVIACAAACPGADFGFADVTAVAAGTRHFLVIRADKTAWAWGANDKGQLGNGGTATPAAPVRVGNLAGVAAIAAGADYSVAILEDGTAYAWGMPPPFLDAKLSPVRVPELDGTAKVSASGHVLALDRAGLGRAWGGRSRAGERDRSVPGREPRMDGLREVAAGTGHSLGVTAAGEVVAWGANTYLQLGVARKPASSEWLEVVDPANPVYTRNAVPVVEFLNATIESGHHFITIDKAEIDNLDAGGIANWQRTGRTWRAWLTPQSAPVAVKPVYRFHSSRWNSHFYTADEDEKNFLVAKNPERDFNKDWVLESTAFYTVPATTSCPALSVTPRAAGLCSGGQQPAVRDCPADYYPIYRAFNVQEGKSNPKRTLPNHRFTSNWIDVFRLVRFFGYTYEGVAFCAPVSSQKGGDLQAFNTYPGDTVAPGEFVQFDYWFGNAGPGAAAEATIVAVIPPVDNALVLCQAYNGAQCPPQGQWNADALRKGVAAPAMPPGGVLRFAVNGQAPAQPQTLSFTSSVGAPSESPDAFGFNNAAPVSRTHVKSATACNVTTTPDSVAFASEGGASDFRIDVPPACNWQVAFDQPWVRLGPEAGTGAITPRLAVERNDAAGERQAVMTVTSGNSSAKIAVRQAGSPPLARCDTIKFGRNGDHYDGLERPGVAVNVETPNDCAWSATVDVPWIALKSAAGRGTGPLEYSIQANAGEERTGNITVSGRSYWVVQGAGAPASFYSGSGGGDGGSDGSGGDGSGGGDAGG